MAGMDKGTGHDRRGYSPGPPLRQDQLPPPKDPGPVANPIVATDDAGTVDYVVEFERIGRHRNVPALVLRHPGLVTETTVDAMAQDIYLFARRYLLSRDVWVDVWMDTPERGRVAVSGGRSGGGTITAQVDV